MTEIPPTEMPVTLQDRTPEAAPPQKRRIAAQVGLALLEVIRARDLPTEILGSEDPSQTMPRRLGLSEAVEAQIGRYKDEARRRGRISDDETRDLFSLVIRRPDSEEVFFQAGELLAANDAPVRGIKRIYPRRVLFAMARRQLRKRVRTLFGRPIGGFAHGSFTLEARGHFLMDMDSGGDACELMTGLAQTILSRYLPHSVRVSQTSCEARKDDTCRWMVMDPVD